MPFVESLAAELIQTRMTAQSNRGLASADESTRRRVASAGGSAPHPRGRGMQRVSPEKRREIASKGGRARHGE